jgi:CBS domain-containing protein
MTGGFRHLLVVSGGDAVGIVSARDLLSALSGR